MLNNGGDMDWQMLLFTYCRLSQIYWKYVDYYHSILLASKHLCAIVWNNISDFWLMVAIPTEPPVRFGGRRKSGNCLIFTHNDFCHMFFS